MDYSLGPSLLEVLTMILDSIITKKKGEIQYNKKQTPLSSFKSKLKPSTHNFKKAISQKGINCIAEIKKSSPSSGTINNHFNFNKIVQTYHKNKNVKAISVLTDKPFFGMPSSSIKKVKQHTNKPIVRKEFIIDPYQIYESRKLGADAFLLIASILTKDQINNFMTIGKKYNMDALVEVHTAEELQKVLATKAEIIGINNRNLDSLKTNTNTTLKLSSKIPKQKVIVAESGYHKSSEIQKLPKNINAVLIGTSLLKQKDINKKINELFGK